MDEFTTLEEGLAEHVAEAEKLWSSIADICEPQRVETLVRALEKQFGFIMDAETNADAIMAIIGWLSRHTLNMSEDSGISHQGALMLLQMGMQRGVAAHIALQQAVEERDEHGLDS